jgi:UDP-N-acetylglucosamine 2-epimerase (non-hydrolysing)
MKGRKLLIIFGTRPEAIKLAPIVNMASDYNLEATVCTTGQHREMLQQCMELFGMKASHELSLMKPNQSLARLTSRVIDGIAQIILQVKPDAVLVQGDTTTAFASAVAAFYARVPIGHVEAGLRTYELTAPFPEEAMRQMTSRIAQYHFAPTTRNRAALLRENIGEDKIFVTGNTVIDSLLWVRDLIQRNARPDLLELPRNLHARLKGSEKKMILITGHRRESFGRGIREICEAIQELAATHSEIEFVYPVHLNPNVIGPVQDILANISNVHLIKPMNYYTFVYLMQRAYFIISDSGGVQEEAPSFGIPVLVTRLVTERTEVVDAGAVKLVGNDRQKIVAEAESLLANQSRYNEMATAQNPYGDGRAAERILGVLCSALCRKE